MKKGIEFFPLDVDFFEDEKIQYISARFGLKGEIFTIKLLGRIYRNGYYTIWDEDAALLFAKVAGRGEITGNLANDIVQELVKRGFFDKAIFDSFSVLTSRGIQKRYLKACERRKSVEIRKEYCLINPENFKNVCMSSSGQHFTEKCKHNVYISGKNDDISSKNVDISPHSRVEESRVDNSKEKVPAGVDVLLRQYAGSDTGLLDALQNFAKTRKALGRPLTGKDVPGLLSDLAILSDDDRDRKIQIINQSSERKWERFYRLKNQKQKKTDNAQKIITDDAVWNNIKGW